jgi:hypothetical protein
MQSGHDAALSQKFRQIISSRRADDKKMIDMMSAFGFSWQVQGCSSQKRAIEVRPLTTTSIPVVKPSELYQQGGRLNAVKAGIPANERVFVLAGLPMIGEESRLPRQLRIIRHNGAAIAKPAKILGGIETKTPERA